MSQKAGVMAKLHLRLPQPGHRGRPAVIAGTTRWTLSAGGAGGAHCGNRDRADQAIDLIIIAKYLERIADHAVNIAQWAIFCVTGEILG
ncbi:MAG: PhoU domain-containing protein [Flavonifractor plautii]